MLPDPKSVDILTLFTVATHAVHLAKFTHAPRLLITAPTPDSGKSTLMTLLAHLVAGPETNSGITEAALLRTIDSVTPTICFDECDQVFPRAGMRSGTLPPLASGSAVRIWAASPRTLMGNPPMPDDGYPPDDPLFDQLIELYGDGDDALPLYTRLWSDLTEFLAARRALAFMADHDGRPH